MYVKCVTGRPRTRRDDLGWVNHLPWVVKVIQITKFRVVIQKVIQILPNLGVETIRASSKGEITIDRSCA